MGKKKTNGCPEELNKSYARMGLGYRSFVNGTLGEMICDIITPEEWVEAGYNPEDKEKLWRVIVQPLENEGKISSIKLSIEKFFGDESLKDEWHPATDWHEVRTCEVPLKGWTRIQLDDNIFGVAMERISAKYAGISEIVEKMRELIPQREFEASPPV